MRTAVLPEPPTSPRCPCWCGSRGRSGSDTARPSAHRSRACEMLGRDDRRDGRIEAEAARPGLAVARRRRSDNVCAACYRTSLCAVPLRSDAVEFHLPIESMIRSTRRPVSVLRSSPSSTEKNVPPAFSICSASSLSPSSNDLANRSTFATTRPARRLPRSAARRSPAGVLARQRRTRPALPRLPEAGRLASRPRLDLVAAPSAK